MAQADPMVAVTEFGTGERKTDPTAVANAKRDITAQRRDAGPPHPMNWPKMSPRERDALVAETIFGEQPPPNLDRNPDCPHEYGSMRDSTGNAWWFEAIWPRRYTTYAADDYLVLVRVRTSWTVKDASAFSDELRSIWSERRVATMGRPLSYSDHIMYQPGDYSHAAILVRNPND